MSSGKSVTGWIKQLKEGDRGAVEKLWERYFERLVRLAHGMMRKGAHLANFDEDVALGAFHSLVRGAEARRFPDLTDRADLWRLLVVITAHKASDLRRKERRQPAKESVELDQILSREPTAEFMADMADQIRLRLDVLGDPELRSIALLRMEGYNIEEIAGKLGCVPRTVQRRLMRIRKTWEQEIAS
jgi:RNA polymerase sigma factor (sigma-70 family)